MFTADTQHSAMARLRWLLAKKHSSVSSVRPKEGLMLLAPTQEPKGREMQAARTVRLSPRCRSWLLRNSGGLLHTSAKGE